MAFDLSLLAVSDEDAAGQDQTHLPEDASGKSLSGTNEMAAVPPPPTAAGTVSAAPAEPHEFPDFFAPCWGQRFGQVEKGVVRIIVGHEFVIWFASRRRQGVCSFYGL